MTRIASILLLILLMGLTARAATNTAASGSYSAVNTAYGLCSDGDTLAIPAGSNFWASTLSITKGISIIGAGSNNASGTIISRAGSVFDVSGVTGTNGIRISSMFLHMSGSYVGGAYPIAIQTSETSTNSPLYKMRVDRVFFWRGYSCVTVVGVGTWGVIDHCTFWNPTIAIQPLGGADAWAFPRVAGTTNTICIEDNIFITDNEFDDVSGYDEQEMITSGHGVRITARNNLWDLTGYTVGNGLPYEQHGKGGVISNDPPTDSDLRGPPTVEIYSNVFKVYNTYRMLNQRGGMNLVFSNVFTATVSGGNVINLTEDNYDSGYMGIDQIANSHYWSNTYNGSFVNPVLQDGDDATYIQLGRDYFTNAPNNTDGIITWSDWDGSTTGSYASGTQKFYPYTPLTYPHPLVTAQDSPPTTFYISRTLGNDSNDGSLASPWQTIAKANAELSAGESVYILAGQYSQPVYPTNTGTAALPILYSSYTNASVTITGAITPLTISGKSYITVSGLNFTNVSRFGLLSSATNNTITNCTFAYINGASFWGGLAIAFSSRSNLVTGCTLHHWGDTEPSAEGDMIDIGGETTDTSYYNRIENNTLYSSGHALLNLRCGYNVVRGNTAHNEVWSGGYGHRCFIVDADPDLPGGYNLIESNRLSFATNSVDGGANVGLDLRTRLNIVRFNTFFNNSDVGLMMAGGSGQVDEAIYNHIYNNTFYTNGLDTSFSDAAIGMQTYGAPFIVKTNSIFNNLFWMHGSSYWNSGANAALAMQIRSNNWEQTSDPLFTDVATAYTATTAGKPDLTLQAGSPCVNAGGFLTTITSASSSGTSFTVADPWFFQSGLGGIAGDLVQLQGQSTTARITGISGSTITVDASVTWTNGQGIALPYSGSSPDIGAYEYQTSSSSGNRSATVSGNFRAY